MIFPESFQNFGAHWRHGWTLLSPSRKKRLLEEISEREAHALFHAWDVHAHLHQRPPEHPDWITWLMIGGRGAGKTRAGAQWVTAQALGIEPYATRQHGRIALVGEDIRAVREVMVGGVSGLMQTNPHWQRPAWIPTRHRFEWPNGAIAQVFSAEDPESLRGPQFHAAWLDELAKWRHAEATFDMLQFGLRLGERPRQVITTTPRPIPLLKRLIADPRSAVTRARTQDNACFLAPAFVETILQRYQGTRLGRQEIDGEIIADRPDALWSRAMIEQCRVEDAPPDVLRLQRIVVAVDPPASSAKGADACGLVAAGRGENDIIYVIADETASGLSPAQWAAKAIALWHRLQADALVVEVNQGGEMVRAVIAEQDRSVPVIAVHAKRGKWLRAEPVAALYEQGKVKHAGCFPALEDELCDFGLDGLSSGRSPDRLDAMVWAVSHLSFGAGRGPRIRTL